MKAKTFASYPYLERQARFAALGPAKIVGPRRYIERALARTLFESVGKPQSVHDHGEFVRAMKAALSRLNRSRIALGATWQTVALGHYQRAFA